MADGGRLTVKISDSRQRGARGIARSLERLALDSNYTVRRPRSAAH